MWNHPDFLPVDSDLDSPAEFIDSILGETEGKDFDPISEIEKLERELNKGEDDSSDGDSDGDDADK